MFFNVELPKKLNKINYFKKEEKGCTLYSYSDELGNNPYIIVDLTDFEIEKDFCINDSTLLAIAKLQPNVELKFNEKGFIAKSSKGKYTAKYIQANLINVNMNYDNEIKVDLSILNRAVAFVSNNDKKPILTGVNINGGVVTATDSFKVYRNVATIENENTTNQITIESDLIKVVSSIFSNNIVDTYYNNNTICFKENNVRVVGRLLEGKYPSLDAILSQFTDEKHELNRNDILETIEFTKIAGANLKESCYISFENNKIIGMGADTFEKEINYNGGEIILEVGNLETALKSFKSDVIYFVCKKSGRGSMVCITGNEENEKIVLLGIVKEQ